MSGKLRRDQEFIVSLVPAGSRVLEVGCNRGDLLAELERRKGTRGRGLEIGTDGVKACVARGIPAVQGDADKDLATYPDRAFDLAILSRTLQELHKPHEVLHHLLRIAHRAVVSIPNFGHWQCRLAISLRGRMPRTTLFPEPWFASKNIHACTLSDFADYCTTHRIVIEESVGFSSRGRKLSFSFLSGGLSNLLAAQAVFVLKKAERR